MGLSPSDVYREAVKFDLVRIVFGVLVFFRYVPQSQQAWATGNASQIAASGGALFLAAALAGGLATRRRRSASRCSSTPSSIPTSPTRGSAPWSFR